MENNGKKVKVYHIDNTNISPSESGDRQIALIRIPLPSELRSYNARALPHHRFTLSIDIDTLQDPYIHTMIVNKSFLTDPPSRARRSVNEERRAAAGSCGQEARGNNTNENRAGREHRSCMFNFGSEQRLCNACTHRLGGGIIV